MAKSFVPSNKVSSSSRVCSDGINGVLNRISFRVGDRRDYQFLFSKTFDSVSCKMNSLPIPPTPRIPSVNAMPEEEEQLEGPRNLEADDGGVDGAIFITSDKIIERVFLFWKEKYKSDFDEQKIRDDIK